jgi:hypothetical protein
MMELDEIYAVDLISAVDDEWRYVSLPPMRLVSMGESLLFFRQDRPQEVTVHFAVERSSIIKVVASESADPGVA